MTVRLAIEQSLKSTPATPADGSPEEDKAEEGAERKRPEAVKAEAACGRGSERSLQRQSTPHERAFAGGGIDFELRA